MSPSNHAELISQMTLEEKVAMLAGSDMWHAPGVERLGIPPLKMSDGPSGARGGKFGNGPRSACFPCGTALAATWDTAIVRRIGVALAQEVKAKGAQVHLAPTTNIHRSPLAGRNFECFSEDPFLAARMTVAYIDGVQSEGVASCVKHYIANDSEFERMTISSEVDERTLREIYLPPFAAAVHEANTWSMMGSYNLLNGVPVCEDPKMLTSVLRDEWGWDGYLVSDWFALKSTANSINAGLDCEMPGPSLWRGQKLVDAVKNGEVDEKVIDASVARMLLVRERTGIMEPGWTKQEETEDDRPEHRAVIREAGANAIVLLENRPVAGVPVLPIDVAAVKTVALIGPNVAVARVQGGGSAGVRPFATKTPLEAITERFGDGVTILHEPGSVIERTVPPVVMPLSAEYFTNDDLSGEPARVEQIDRGLLRWYGGEEDDPVTKGQFSVRVTGTYTAHEAGEHQFALTAVGRAKLLLDGEEIVDNWTAPERGDSFWGAGSKTRIGTATMAAGESRTLEVQFVARQTGFICGLQIGALPAVPDDLIERAAAAAAKADVAVVIAGMSDEWESEGHDRKTMDLPGTQDELIAAVVAANPRTAVLVNAGSPITMPWADDVAALAQVWYLGQEMGPAIAAVLAGDVDASGRLPQTIPYRLQDTPAFVNYPGENGKVRYGESLFVGYRWYDARDQACRYPFGHGLSYATFEWSPPRLSATEIDADGTVTVEVDVTNTSDRDGREVVQVYVGDDESRLVRPPKELKGFAKVDVPAGATATATITLGRDAFSYYDPGRGGWLVEPGTFTLHIARSAGNVAHTTALTVR